MPALQCPAHMHYAEFSNICVKMAESRPLALLEEQVNCAVCLDIYDNPKTLSCQHYFCEKCIVCLVNQNKIVCPTCRKTTEGVVADLPTAFLINNMIELYNASKKSSTQNCLQHKRSLDLYCSSCKQLVCAKCAVKQHKGHEIDMLIDCLEEHKKEIEVHLLIIKQRQSRMKTIINDLANREKEIKAQGEQVKTEIEQFTETIQTQLKESVNAIVLEKDAKIRKQKKEADTVLATLETCMKSVESRMQGDAQQIISEKQAIIDTMTATTDKTMNIEDVSTNEVADITFVPPEIGKSIKVGGKIQDLTPFLSTSTCTSLPVKNISRAIKIVNPDTKEEVAVSSVLSKKCKLKHTIPIDKPKEIAVAPDGTLVISQENGRCITIINNNEYYTIPCVANVTGLTVTLDDYILVVDNSYNCISKYSRQEGSLVNKAEAEIGLNHFESPQGIAVDTTGRIYVCDTGNCRVPVLKPSNMKVSHVLDVRREYTPTDVAINSKGVVCVCDSNSCTILYITKDTHQCIGSDVLKRPSRIAIGAEDIAYVTDNEKKQVIMFDSNGKCLGSIRGEGGRPKKFQQLQGIAANKDGDIYVCDGLESVIYNYQYNY